MHASGSIESIFLNVYTCAFLQIQLHSYVHGSIYQRPLECTVNLPSITVTALIDYLIAKYIKLDLTG